MNIYVNLPVADLDRARGFFGHNWEIVWMDPAQIPEEE